MTSAQTDIRVGIGELIAAVPHMLGFNAAGSVVVLAFDLPGQKPGQLGFTQRLDIPSADAAENAAAVLMSNVARHGAGAVVVLAFPAPGQDAAPVLEALVSAGVDLHAVTVVDGDRFRGYGCADACCATWRPVSAVPAALSSGLVLASRRDLAASLGAGAGAAAIADEVAALNTPNARDTFAAWARICDVHGTQVARLPARVIATGVVGAAASVQVRDVLAAWLCPGTLAMDVFDADVVAVASSVLHAPGWGPGEQCGTVLAGRLKALCRSLPQHPSSAAALTLAGTGLWYAGEGVTARIVAERALQAEPGYRLAVLLSEMLDLGIRPGSQERER